MSLDDTVQIKNDTLYYIVHSADCKIDCWGPDDESWLFSGCKRGVRIVVDDDDIYVIATKNTASVEKSAEAMAYSMARKLRMLHEHVSVCSRWG